MDDVYKQTHKRATNELESDDTALPPTKAVMLYGWDSVGLTKVKLACNASGLLQIDPTDIDTRYWTTATDQTLLTGDKSGSFDLTTTGVLTTPTIQSASALALKAGSGYAYNWILNGEYVLILNSSDLTLGSYGANRIALYSGSGNNLNIKLGDALGATKLSIQDNSPAEMAYIDSNGNGWIEGHFAMAEVMGNGGPGSSLILSSNAGGVKGNIWFGGANTSYFDEDVEDLIITGMIKGGNITDSGLTSGRIPYASTGGLLVDNSALTFATTTGLYVDGNLGIGVAPSTYGGVGTEYVLNLLRTFTDNTTPATKAEINGVAWWYPTAVGNVTQYVIGSNLGVYSHADEVTNNDGYLRGSYVFGLHRSNSTIAEVDGLVISAGTWNGASDTTGTITNLYGLRISGTKTASSTIDSAYGLYVSGMQGTNAYDIYANDAGAKNYFAGIVGIGTASPTAVLHLKAGTATASTAPLKLSTGTNLTVPENGVFEYDGTSLFFTTNGTRYKFIMEIA